MGPEDVVLLVFVLVTFDDDVAFAVELMCFASIEIQILCRQLHY